jgi:hypothetical protein
MMVRFVDGFDDLEIDRIEITVKEVKEIIAAHRPTFQLHRVRIIWRGRFLKDSEVITSASTVHCICSDINEIEQSGQQPMRIGFDRLIDMGFEVDEVQELRQQFHALRGVDVFDPSQIQEAEEEWIENTNPQLEDGNEFDLLIGLVFGFFCGIFLLFWVKERNMYTRKQQQGIFTGLLLNISFGLLRLL